MVHFYPVWYSVRVHLFDLKLTPGDNGAHIKWRHCFPEHMGHATQTWCTSLLSNILFKYNCFTYSSHRGTIRHTRNRKTPFFYFVMSIFFISESMFSAYFVPSCVLKTWLHRSCSPCFPFSLLLCTPFKSNRPSFQLCCLLPTPITSHCYYYTLFTSETSSVHSLCISGLIFVRASRSFAKTGFLWISSILIDFRWICVDFMESRGPGSGGIWRPVARN